MQKIIFFVCALGGACSAWLMFPPSLFAHAAVITDYGRGYSGHYFNDPTGYREVFTQEVTFHLYHNFRSCSVTGRPCADNEFFVTFTPDKDIAEAYGISIDDPAIVTSELYNGQETGTSFVFSHDNRAALDPPGDGGAVQFRGTATTSAWAILNSQTLLWATTTYALQAGSSYDVVGWWYDGKPSNLMDGQTITIGIWVPDPTVIPDIAASSLGQYESDGVAAIVERSLATTTIIFSGVPQSAGTKPLQLQVEVEPSNVPFEGVPTATSTFAAPGVRAAVSVSGLAPGGYHWQARAADEEGNVSSWRTLSDPPADVDFGIGNSAYYLYHWNDQSGSIGTDNAQAGTSFGPLAVRIKLGQPLGGTGSTTLSLTMYQEGSSECGMPAYLLQGYSDSDYQAADGPPAAFGNWTDASGAPIASRDYAGVIAGTAAGRINPFDYYALSFNSCDFGRPVSIAAAPGATYACTWQVNNYCYAADVAGVPFMKLDSGGPREPVVIVPGIAGSALARVSDGEEVWPNIGKMASVAGVLSHDAYLDDLALDAQGHSTIAMSAPDILRTVTTTISFLAVQKDFYGDLINAFVSDGYVENKDLFVAPYDWRLGMDAETGALDARIQQAVAASPDGKINIVAHSMGGVLINRYLRDRPGSSFLDKLVLVGVPQLGAPKAFKVLNYGDNLGVALGPFDILNSSEIKKIAENMPSLYELLPSSRYVQVNGGYVRDFRNGNNGSVLDYDAIRRLMASNSSDSRNAALLDAAAAFHAGLDGQPVSASNGISTASAPSVYNILGCRMPTISEFDLYDGGVVDVAQTTGDGTVPEVSAMNLADSFHNYFVDGGATGIDHGGLVADARPISLIVALIDDGAIADADLPQGISAALADCVAGWHHASSTDGTAGGGGTGAWFEFSAHGSVDLEISDPTGLHTGILYDGSVEVSIPGSSYDVIGDNTFVTVPASTSTSLGTGASLSTSTYKVEVTKRKISTAANASSTTGTSATSGSAATSTTDTSTTDTSTTATSTAKTTTTTTLATVKVKKRTTDQVTDTATYVSVPLQNVSATAELDFSGFDGDLSLAIDNDGDGNVDATSSPTAVLTATTSAAEAIADVTPPEIVPPTIPAEVFQNSTTTLYFSATDAGSGVATTTATLNGNPVANGEIVMFKDVGKNVLIITAFDKAGNPRIYEIDFQVVAPADAGGGAGGGGTENGEDTGSGEDNSGGNNGGGTSGTTYGASSDDNSGSVSSNGGGGDNSSGSNSAGGGGGGTGTTGASGGGGGEGSSSGATYPAPGAPNPQVLGASTTVSVVPSLAELFARLRLLAAKLFASMNSRRPLSVGAKGNDVWALQVFLITGGGRAARSLAAVGPTGFFGAFTTNALKEYQTGEKITPVSGYLGPKTRAAIRKVAESDIL